MLILLIILFVIALICCCIQYDTTNKVFLCVSTILLGIAFWRNYRRTKKMIELSEVSRKKIEKIITDNNLTLSTIYELYCPLYLMHKMEVYRQTVQVDKAQRKILFTNSLEDNFTIISFGNFLNYEIYEDGDKSSTTIDWGNGIKTSDFSNYCNELKLIVRFKNSSSSQFEFNLVTSSISKNSSEYKLIRKSLQSVVSFLEVLKAECGN